MDKKSVSIMTALCIFIFMLFGIIVIDSQKPSDDQYADIKAEIQKAASHETTDDAKEHETVKPEKQVEKVVAKTEAKQEKKVAHKKEATKPAPKKEEPAKSDLPAGRTEVADVIMMDNPAYAKHKKGIVQFTHKAHIDDYQIACGDCHHDSKGKPLTLKMGDPVQNCIACHSKPSRKEKGVKGKAVLEFHAEALHQNCIGCHKAYNKENGTKAAPAGCSKCHPKK
jgi:hypothetical protein